MQNKIVKLRTGRQGKIKPGHPWIYKRQVLKPDSSVKPGDIVSVVNSEEKFIGRGYYNPASEISVRILNFTDEAIDEKFFSSKIETAFGKRKNILTKTNAYRAVFSEADSLPGLIVDVYNDTAVFQILTLGMDHFRKWIVTSIREILKPQYIYEKSESPFRELEGLKTVKGWVDDKGPNPIEIYEGKAKFLVDIENGHKTGFYLDQRTSRMAIEPISKGKKVLDLFCYTGPFGIHAAMGGASFVRGIDIKNRWLELAAENARLNGVLERIEFIKGDVFSLLRNIYKSQERFDIIIVDPPSFLKNKYSLRSAEKGYKELNLIAMKVLNEEGVLATFSCSHNMPNERFAATLKEAAIDAKKRFDILKRCHQAEDHPIVKAIPETEYLKGYFLKVRSA